ncbi:MAG: DegT/DnrJ/EryC1/StrS family aminotransferase [Chlorobi bacterium]|nr:DegT/DnrJ/EryC1/StrS family aminotransferase [Chlorobiota bacterium]
MIDLRSDTVTQPSQGMREAMVSAPVGDDVYGEDPTVNRLEEMVAEMTGKERGLFVPTGTMGNQLCLKALTEPGDEVIVGKKSHIFNYETGAPGVLSGVQLHTVDDRGGALNSMEVEMAVREKAYYLPKTSVVAQEQTHNKEGGRIVDLTHLISIARFAKEVGVSAHLDGARIWNAVVEADVSVKKYAELFDTVSLSLSKGLGAPIGSVLVGSTTVVAKAHKFRKIWGGGWRQAGILAAAGIYALENNIERLKEDHKKARSFYERIKSIDGIQVGDAPQTNILIFRLGNLDVKEVARQAAKENVMISAAFKDALRVVFHMDVSLSQAEEAAGVLSAVVTKLKNMQPAS